eukprot:6176883-Pleurochrysis_carterae.AAC.2
MLTRHRCFQRPIACKGRASARLGEYAFFALTGGAAQVAGEPSRRLSARRGRRRRRERAGAGRHRRAARTAGIPREAPRGERPFTRAFMPCGGSRAYTGWH